MCLKAYDEEPIPEKAAEVFAAEFIWPADEFQQAALNFGLSKNNCSDKDIVGFKKWAKVPVSYKFIIKRLEWFKIIEKGQFDRTKFKLVEYQIYGKPYHLRYR